MPRESRLFRQVLPAHFAHLMLVGMGGRIGKLVLTR